jgi:hypothetical protein
MNELPDEVGGVNTPPVRYRSNSVNGIVDVFSVVDRYKLSFYEGHALKYLVRLGRKGTDESNLGKCLHFLRESESRAPREVSWWTCGIKEDMTIDDVISAFGLDFNPFIGKVAYRLLMSKVDNEPRYWLRTAADELEKYMKANGIVIQRGS